MRLASFRNTPGGLEIFMSRNIFLVVTALSRLIPSSPLLAETPPAIASFVENHCLHCHTGDGAESDFDLESLSFELNDAQVLAKWVKAYDRVRRGEMPPTEADQPEKRSVDAYLSALHPKLISAEEARIASEGRSAVRRLSRGEHINALRDLLELPHLTAGDKLPPDSLSDGFGKSSSSLPLSHVQIDRYLEVANSAIREAMAPQRTRPKSQTVRIWVSDYQGETITKRRGKDTYKTLRLIEDSPFFYLPLKEGDGMPIVNRQWDESFDNWPGNFSKRQPGHVLDTKPFMDAVGIHDHADQRIGNRFNATVAGHYKIRIGAYAYRSNRGSVEPTDRTEVVAVFGGERLLGTVDVTSEAKVQELDVWLNEGEEIRASAASLPLWRIEIGEKERRYLAVDIPAVAFQGFELEGPIVEVWPPESHQRLFGDLPMSPVDHSQDGLDYQVISDTPEQDAKKLLASFLVEAYRRPVRTIDFDVPLEVFNRRLTEGASFQDAMIAAYASVLSSPHFVLVPMSPGRLPSEQIANRLSLFLWNSPADGSLRNSVTDDVLNSPAKFQTLVDQMIDDPRSLRFVDHFLDHWLDLRNIGVTEPDENLYSGYSPWLLESMRLETRAFFREMLRKDLPARTVFDSDFAMVNGALAELYGIDDVKGSAVRRSALGKNSVRGGLVAQASVLKVSANGTTTSPVVRGVYVMDRLLGDPLPPPPEAVPAVEPDLSGAITMREQLAKHRADPSCASCHTKIDPPGFALESFDVMGRFRMRYHSLSKGDPVDGLNRRAKPIKYKLALPVDASGELPGGKSFRDIEEFRRLVLEDERAIARNLLQRLVVYATGAPVGIADRRHIEGILDQTADTGFGLRSMIHCLVQSPMFTNK